MKQFLSNLSLLAAGMILAFCGGCKDEKEVVPVKVSTDKTEVALSWEENSEATFHLECDGDWNIEVGEYDWLDIYPLSGSGDANVTVTASSANTATSKRQAFIKVIGPDNQISMKIVQDAADVVKVNPSELFLVPTSGSSATFNIECAGNWNITGVEEWLNISASSGKGNTSVTVTALSDNNKASNRVCNLTVKGAAGSASIAVTQLAGLKGGCEVTIADEILLEESFALKLNFGSKATFFYAGYFDASAAGWTDDKIAAQLLEMEAINAENGYVVSLGGFTPGESVVFCFLACDQDGNRGEVVRKTIKFPNDKNAPEAYIQDVKYSDSYWLWSTKIGATANEYYQAAWSGWYAMYYGLFFTRSEIAFMIKDTLNERTSYVQSQDWRMPRASDETDFLVATWARRNGQWSTILTKFYGSISDDNSRPANRKSALKTKKSNADSRKLVCHSKAEYEKALKSMKVIRK